MELLPIGEAARRVGLRASALRFYDERGIVRPQVRRGARRYYGPDELRRLVFIELLRQVGVGLEVASAMLEQPGEGWRAALRAEIEALDGRIAQAQAARAFLTHALECPAARPVRDCPTMLDLLDRRLSGESLESLARAEGAPPPPPPQARRAPRPGRGSRK